MRPSDFCSWTPRPAATWPRATRWLRGAILVALLLSGLGRGVAQDPPDDVFSHDVARFTKLLSSPAAERRIEGLQGLSNLKYWPGESAVMKLLDDPAPDVQREALQALNRLGSGKCVPRLIALLDHPSWEIRQNAWLGLCRMTGMNFSAGQSAAWNPWWAGGASTNHLLQLLNAATNPAPAIPRASAYRALPFFATAAHEDALIPLLHRSGLSLDERNSVAEALERVGTPRSIPVLAGFHTDHAAWALGRIGGAEAEKALLKFPKTLATMLNLDRLRSTNCAPLIPLLVSHMGLITFRSQPDDVMNADAQPIQRVGASLIRRSGQAPEFLHQVLLELEYTMKPPPAGPRPPMPEAWKKMLEAMRSELKPGFVREDGLTTSQPVTALYHIATDPALKKRLLPLLHHPAFVPRVYVAMTLAKLQATEALPDMLKIIREGYAFSDAVALASGKHFDQSQTVRWRGFLCMALGRMGGDDARVALEQFAADPRQPRDIRYSSVVGLGFIASSKSLPVLKQVASQDLIWMVRDGARQVAEDIAIKARESSGFEIKPGS